jgi:hypothetical protein
MFVFRVCLYDFGEIFAGVTLFAGSYLFRRAGAHYLSSLFAALGSQIYHMVGGKDDGGVVLYDDYRVSFADEPV